ncbi:MAG: hypothetical protein ACFFG0_01980 [Candidatus Thorarchaeota archaeon]
MKLNSNHKLILKDVHLYDIKACHYTILNNLGFDLTGIDPEDKIGRNIQIGKMMRGNPRLTSLLRKTTESVINDYIVKNNIKDDEIIIRQYDGMILTRTLENIDIGHIPLDRRKTFQIFISSINRDKYIALDNNFETIIKGVANRYKQIDDIYIRLCKIVDMTNKDSIFTNLQRVKDNLLNSNDPNLFGIPTKNKKYIIFLNGYGELEVSKSTLKIMDTNDIDRERYFKHYIEPFTKSIVFELVR